MQLNENELQDNILYHYTSSAVLLNYILENLTLQFNLLERTNDPIEYKKIKTLMLSENPFTNEDFNKHYDNENDINSYKKKLKVACFCIDDEERLFSRKSILGKGFARSRLWAQYAEKHSGVCIVINKDKLKEKLNIKNISYKEGKIEYTDINFPLDKISTYHLGQAIQNKEELKEALFVKYLDFKDENEYRFLIYTDTVNPEFIDIRDCIEAVIIGDNCIDNCYEIVKQKCKDNNIDTYYINWSHSGPNIGIDSN